MSLIITELKGMIEKVEDKLEKDEYTILMNIIERIEEEMDELNTKVTDKPILLPEEESETEFEIYDKVLVRDSKYEPWIPSIFCGYTNEKEFPYRASDLYEYKICIPYKGNEHLVGKKG